MSLRARPLLLLLCVLALAASLYPYPHTDSLCLLLRSSPLQRAAGWYRGVLLATGREGIFPASYVKVPLAAVHAHCLALWLLTVSLSV